MIYVSLAILGLAFATVAMPQGEVGAPLSVELAKGNPFGWALLVAVCVMLFLFARRLNKNSHRIRTSLLLINVVGLIAMAFTPNDVKSQEVILLVLCLLTSIWFYVVGLDYDSDHVTPLSAVCCLLLPFLTSLNLAVAEMALIFYAVYCINVLYFLCLDPKGRPRWP